MHLYEHVSSLSSIYMFKEKRKALTWVRRCIWSIFMSISLYCHYSFIITIYERKKKQFYTSDMISLLLSSRSKNYHLLILKSITNWHFFICYSYDKFLNSFKDPEDISLFLFLSLSLYKKTKKKSTWRFNWHSKRNKVAFSQPMWNLSKVFNNNKKKLNRQIAK